MTTTAQQYQGPCEICDQEMTYENYGGGTCPGCGMGYDYDEGNYAKLDDEMRAAILEILTRRKHDGGVQAAKEQG